MSLRDRLLAVKKAWNNLKVQKELSESELKKKKTFLGSIKSRYNAIQVNEHYNSSKLQEGAQIVIFYAIIYRWANKEKILQQMKLLKVKFETKEINVCVNTVFDVV